MWKEFLESFEWGRDLVYILKSSLTWDRFPAWQCEELCRPAPQQNVITIKKETKTFKVSGNVLKDTQQIKKTFIQGNLLKFGKESVVFLNQDPFFPSSIPAEQDSNSLPDWCSQEDRITCLSQLPVGGLSYREWQDNSISYPASSCLLLAKCEELPFFPSPYSWDRGSSFGTVLLRIPGVWLSCLGSCT